MDMRTKMVTDIIKLDTYFNNIEGIWIGEILDHNGLQKWI